MAHAQHRCGRVEVVGGATRILVVKTAALQFFGLKQLDGSLNGDEAAALGATLYAADLTEEYVDFNKGE